MTNNSSLPSKKKKKKIRSSLILSAILANTREWDRAKRRLIFYRRSSIAPTRDNNIFHARKNSAGRIKPKSWERNQYRRLKLVSGARLESR